MANFTKKAIEASFLKLLDRHPLSRITVKDIVTDCGVNRNTFYYYFKDIPALIEGIVMEDAEKIIGTYPTVEKINDCLHAVIDRMLAQKQAVLHIYHSVNREIYESYLWRVLEHVINAYMAQLVAGRHVNEADLRVIRKYMTSLGFGIFSLWLREGMTEDIKSDFTRLLKLQTEHVGDMIRQCLEEAH